VTPVQANFLSAGRDFAVALGAFLDELAADDRASQPPQPQIDLTHFDPKWKTGKNLSALGKAAIFLAFDKFMPQNEAARLFQITRRSAHRYHKSWKTQRTA
jgi:hypothetical protein